MKNIYRSVVFYYLLVPALLALWPLLVWTVYLPRAKRVLQDEVKRYKDAQDVIENILSLDRGRLDIGTSSSGAVEFDYGSAVEATAKSCGISSATYKLSSGLVRTSSGQKSQSAQVILEDVDVVRFARFLSEIELAWASLQCEKVRLTKKKGLADSWRVELDFKYYY